jgi:hypothetical protein
LYPSGSGDRAASLADVRKVAVEFMGNQTTAAGRASLEFAKALADLESGEEAALLELERLARHAGSNQIRVLAASNLARALANDGQQSRTKTAIDLLEQTVSKDSSFAPQLALSRIEVELARLESNKAPNKEKELSALVQQAQALGKNYGDYWRTRAEALLVGKLSSDSVSDSQLAVDLLLAEARQLWAKGDPESMQDAAKRLLKGRDAQAAQGKASAAITLSNQAATLFRELKDWNNAVDAVRQTSIQFSTDPNAAQAHKWAIDAHVPRLREKISDAAQRELYVELLREQIRLWPDADVSRDSKRMLRDWCLGQGMRVTYVDALIESLPESKIVDLGQSTVLECAEQTLQLPNDVRTKVVDGLLTGEVLPSQHLLYQLSKQMARAVAILSDLSTSDFCRSSSTRQQNWSEFEDRSAGLQPGLLGDFLECAADVGRIQLQLPINQASPGWNKLADSSRAALVVALVDALDCLEPQAKIGYWTKLGLDKDWSKFDTKGYSPAVEVAAARVAIWSGDSTAGDQLKLRAEKERRDGQVQLMHAYWRADQRDWGAAKKIVTQLAGLSKAGSRLQLSAKWAMMRFQIASGETVEAVQAAKLLIASQPGLDSIWLARFNAIAK